MVNIASHNGRVRAIFHFDAADAIRVYVALVEVALKRIRARMKVKVQFYQLDYEKTLAKTHHAILKAEDAHVASIVNVAAFERGCGVVLHPDAGQIIARDFTIFISARGLLRNVDADVFTIDDLAVFDERVRVRAFDAEGGAD